MYQMQLPPLSKYLNYYYNYNFYYYLILTTILVDIY